MENFFTTLKVMPIWVFASLLCNCASVNMTPSKDPAILAAAGEVDKILRAISYSTSQASAYIINGQASSGVIKINGRFTGAIVNTRNQLIISSEWTTQFLHNENLTEAYTQQDHYTVNLRGVYSITSPTINNKDFSSLRTAEISSESEYLDTAYSIIINSDKVYRQIGSQAIFPVQGTMTLTPNKDAVGCIIQGDSLSQMEQLKTALDKLVETARRQ